MNNLPESAVAINDLNNLLLDLIPDVKVTKLDYSNFKVSAGKIISGKPIQAIEKIDIGSMTELKNISAHISYVLGFTRASDCDEAEQIVFGPFIRWIIKRVVNFKLTGKEKSHIVLDKLDHSEIQKYMNLSSQKLAYKSFIQVFTLLIYLYHTYNDGDVKNAFSRVLSGEDKLLKLKKNLGDLKNIEPFYQWALVTSARERGFLVALVNQQNFFSDQNKLLNKYRNNNDSAESVKALQELSTKVSKAMPKGTIGVIYGRLKFYHALQKDDKEVPDKKKGKEHAAKQVARKYTYKEILSEAAKARRIDLFAEVNIAATATSTIARSSEIMDLTSKYQYDVPTGTVLISRKNLDESDLYTKLHTARRDKTITSAQSVVLDLLEKTLG